jgi:hypothetical protein
MKTAPALTVLAPKQMCFSWEQNTNIVLVLFHSGPLPTPLFDDMWNTNAEMGFGGYPSRRMALGNFLSRSLPKPTSSTADQDIKVEIATKKFLPRAVLSTNGKGDVVWEDFLAYRWARRSYENGDDLLFQREQRKYYIDNAIRKLVITLRDRLDDWDKFSSFRTSNDFIFTEELYGQYESNLPRPLIKDKTGFEVPYGDIFLPKYLSKGNQPFIRSPSYNRAVKNAEFVTRSPLYEVADNC